ncbi:hypothetical protein QQF64_009008 [Cirrhinus molitorella]|uniref:Uncharacterized protein n=1 Tax=Cirrhinus molitorella TaxID=172907 RepID=A0ABR3MA78_9TELE
MCGTTTGKNNKNLHLDLEQPETTKRKNDRKLQPSERDFEEPHTTKTSSKNPRRKWSAEEIQAVEKTLMDFIRSGKVPGKAQCIECIENSPAALQERSWEGVKFYVKNRIDSLKRKRGQADTSAVLSQSTSQPEREKVSWASRAGCVLSSTLIAFSHVSTTNHVINQCIKYPEVSACCDSLLVFVTRPLERLEHSAFCPLDYSYLLDTECPTSYLLLSGNSRAVLVQALTDQDTKQSELGSFMD